MKSSPRGMTLLEVLLAVSIAAFLGVAIYQSIVIQYAQADGGREKAARAQLIRGVIGQVQRDMRNVFTGWQPVSKDAGSTSAAATAAGQSNDDDDDSSSGSSSKSSGSSTSSSSSSTATATTSEYDVPSGGIFGYSDAITIVVRRTPAGLNFDPGLVQASNPMPTSDLRLVRYWFGSPAAESGDTRTGLVRQEIGYVPDATAGDTSASGAKTELMAEEVRSLAIRYYDGYGWATEWSQTSQNGPQAVEVILGVVRPEYIPYLANPSVLATAEQNLQYYRIIVSSQDYTPPSDNSGASSSSSSDSPSSSGSSNQGSQGNPNGTGGGAGQGGGAGLGGGTGAGTGGGGGAGRGGGASR